MKYSFLLVLSLWLSSAFAHPVIYKHGLVLSTANMENYSDNQLLYSFTHKWAAGVNYWRFSKDDTHTELGLARLNHLLYRHNGESSQANIYLSAGIGIGDNELTRRDTKEAYMLGFEADWETRVLFAAIKHYQFHMPQSLDIQMSTLRLGFSPYEAPFDELQNWFMIQAMHMPEVSKEIMLTPMLRFFYKNVLWEFGSSFRGDWMLNLMVHY